MLVSASSSTIYNARLAVQPVVALISPQVPIDAGTGSGTGTGPRSGTGTGSGSGSGSGSGKDNAIDPNAIVVTTNPQCAKMIAKRILLVIVGVLDVRYRYAFDTDVQLVTCFKLQCSHHSIPLTILKTGPSTGFSDCMNQCSSMVASPSFPYWHC